jgi:hypothetical protein
LDHLEEATQRLGLDEFGIVWVNATNNAWHFMSKTLLADFALGQMKA